MVMLMVIIMTMIHLLTGIGSDGEILRIHNMSRDCGGTYECVADNGVGEKAIRRINIAVNCKYKPNGCN
ncbi:hypothetical protein DPMN_115114 [Dreissena polymorpha]|uniref:Uncharacterized protein n=1 Tax=Dreissena polymorpha TaxID=45954 RepID=A0A9D4KL51_DREPO|nr:hypothetical protein DPMN_115114 [Dreissena polymorpha]